jgi:hypothetical protein
MSWVENIENAMTIVTGDGKTYTLLWRGASKGLEWNVAEFEFPEVAGTLVKKSKRKGQRINLELYFVGDDHLDQFEAFNTSLNDTRPCVLNHPHYGSINVQIASLSIDNNAENVTKITGVAIETIVEDNPKESFEPVDQVPLLKEINDEELTLAFTETPSSSDVNKMASDNDKNYKQGVKFLTIPEEVENYFNLFNQANSFVNTATESPLRAMRTTIAMINAPAKFTADVEVRTDLLIDQFETLRANLNFITKPSSKQIYQAHGGAIISALCLAATTPLTSDYPNSTKVLSILDKIVDTYTQFIEDLDFLQSVDGGKVNAFIPHAPSIIALNYLYNISLEGLFKIALSSKKERSIILEKDSNVILLTKRLYGLDQFDANMNELINNNGWGLIHMLGIKKGTKVIYYV